MGFKSRVYSIQVFKQRARNYHRNKSLKFSIVKAGIKIDLHCFYFMFICLMQLELLYFNHFTKDIKFNSHDKPK